MERSRSNTIGSRILARKWHEHERLIGKYKMIAGECSEEQLHWQPEGGKWSIIQVLEHLFQSESATISFIRAFDFGKSDRKPGMGSDLRARLTSLLLNLPVRFKKPVRLPAPSTEGTQDAGTLFRVWDQKLDAFNGFLARFPRERLHHFVLKHPMAGRFNLPQVLGFLNAHLAHHFFQIDRIKRRSGFPKNDT